jgi:hypothetical protein
MLRGYFRTWEDYSGGWLSNKLAKRGAIELECLTRKSAVSIMLRCTTMLWKASDVHILINEAAKLGFSD